MDGNNLAHQPDPQNGRGDLSYRNIPNDDFWQKIPGFEKVTRTEFLDYRWQLRHLHLNATQLQKTLGSLGDPQFLADLRDGLKVAPMTMQLTPYLIARMNWLDPYNCPLRRQFLTLASKLQADHPKLQFDALHEQEDSPVPGITHRYSDRALFLALDSCPVYCRFCTRSYAVGGQVEKLHKLRFAMDQQRWQNAFRYISQHQEIEDVLISGGDVINLPPRHLESIGLTLLGIKHIRRIRFATKGIGAFPQKIITHQEWFDALASVTDYGRTRFQQVMVHTHINHPQEISWMTRLAAEKLFERGIPVRNQGVLLRGVNDSLPVMLKLIRQLAFINIQPYYIFTCDMVKGIEDLRTPLSVGINLEKQVRSAIAGFLTPTFACDVLGGGGKRQIHSYESYNRETGIAVYQAPAVKPKRLFFYFDPLHSLDPSIQRQWTDQKSQQQMLKDAIAAATNAGSMI